MPAIAIGISILAGLCYYLHKLNPPGKAKKIKRLEFDHDQSISAITFWA